MSKRLHDILPTISKRIIDKIGAECIYVSKSGEATISVYVDTNVADIGDFGQYTGEHIELEFLKAEVDPKRGDEVRIGSTTYIVEGKVASDLSNNSTIRVTAYEP